MDNRTNHMNHVFERGTRLTAVFDQVGWITEYLAMVKAMGSFPEGGDEPEFVKLREGILAMAVVAAKHDGEISHEFMYKLINGSEAALADLQQLAKIDACSFKDLHSRLKQTESHSALKLLEPLGEQGYSAAINLLITTAHQVASHLTEFAQRSNKSLSGLGSFAGGMAINVAIEDIVNACKARDEAWDRYGKMCWELERIAKDVTASVRELMK
ncbi:hypothetical protein BCR44DRAFT_1425154 [Catenaria anguillulae PL171]|uniref:Uncharacterized protein n=1 Tax=Catenaria anguillulae PL171 TaxID=765915 RepID=A0A1Y2I160_9FUNG|nr:hypothetical protein BCR44DRAFT_1425154 [Catenaria anguillulae PL171]